MIQPAAKQLASRPASQRDGSFLIGRPTAAPPRMGLVFNTVNFYILCKNIKGELNKVVKVTVSIIAPFS